MQNIAANLAKYEGNVYLGLIDPATGDFSGYVGPIECDSFIPGRDKGTQTLVRSKKRDHYNQIAYSETDLGDPTLKMVFKEQPSLLFGLAFAANRQDFSVTGASVTAETYPIPTTIPDDGYNILLAHRNLTSVVVKNSHVTPATAVLGTDYDLDPRIGLLTILPGSTVLTNTDTPVSVAYTYADLTGSKFDGETVNEFHCRVLFDGKNRINGTDLQMEYYDVQIPAPQNIMDLLSSDIVSLELDGTPTVPTGKAGPYQVLSGITVGS